MADFISLQKEITKAYRQLASLEKRALQNVGDISIILMIDSIKSIIKDLEKHWEQLSASQMRDICKYRIVDNVNQRYFVSGLSSSLLSFQKLFSQTVHSMGNGAIDRTSIPKNVSEKTGLALDYTFSGSFGFALSAPSQSDLFKGEFDSAVDMIFDLSNLKSSDSVRSSARDLGGGVIKRLSEWSSANIENGFSTDISWKSNQGRTKENFVYLDGFQELSDLIVGTTNVSNSYHDLKATLLGIDVKSGSFRLSGYGLDGREFKGKLDEGFDKSKQWNVNQSYSCKIVEITETNLSTDGSKTTYRLLSLESAE